MYLVWCIVRNQDFYADIYLMWIDLEVEFPPDNLFVQVVTQDPSPGKRDQVRLPSPQPSPERAVQAKVLQ